MIFPRYVRRSAVGILGLVLIAGCTASPTETPAPKTSTGQTGATTPTSPVASPVTKAASPTPATAVTKSAPSPSPQARAASPSPSPTTANQVVFTAVDYSFNGPDTVPAGWTTIRLENQGREPHHLTLLKLAPGRTFADVTAAMQSGSPEALQGLFTEEGGPNAIGPDANSTAIVNLEPGNYVLACFIPSPDGVPHIAKGMIKPLTVTPAPAAASAEPRAAITITGVDFAFRVAPEITAGNQMIRFTNEGEQHHEVALVRLAPGRTVQDLIAFFEPSAGAAPAGPPPGEFLGGMSGIEAGKHGYFPAQITPGNYGLICFLPDVTDPQGTPHFAKGMVSEFTVR